MAKRKKANKEETAKVFEDTAGDSPQLMRKRKKAKVFEDAIGELPQPTGKTKKTKVSEDAGESPQQELAEERIDQGGSMTGKSLSEMAQQEDKPQKRDNFINGVAAATKKRKAKEVAPYGNYRNYYGYRVGNDMEKDPRFKVLKKEWFEDKDCLDIGCNNGLITINIAKKFNCHTILGIDIDRDRVEDCRWNLRKIMRKDKIPKWKSNTAEQLVSEHAGNASTIEDQRKVKTDALSVEKDLSDIVSFQQDNFVWNCRPLPMKHYDTIVCLSVTKWVHLNWGDEGLITLFTKMWRLLHPGGILVLEPQPWKSYESNRLVTETTAANYKKIEIYPEDFQEILLDKIGFRTIENVSTCVPGSTAGFGRPVLILRK